MNKKKTSSLIGYIVGVLFALGYALYFNGKIGWLFFAILLTVPAMSFAITFYLYKAGKITFSASLLGTTLYKGETASLKITAENASILPAPFIAVSLFSADSFERSDDSKTSVGFTLFRKEAFAYEVKYTAKIWGCAVLGVEKAELTDFMGFFSFPLYTERGLYEHSGKAMVIPDVPDIPSDSPLIKAVCEAISYDDDSEETKETNGLIFTGTPGYEHREYREGDPVKRINWKLSLKRDALMIRLDDEILSSKQVVILDSVHGKTENASPLCYWSPLSDERTVEGVLAVLYSLVRLNYEVSFRYFDGDNWVLHAVSSPDDIQQLRIALAGFSFTKCDSKNRPPRIPAEELSFQSAGFLLFTSFLDSSLVSEVSGLSSLTGKVSYITPAECPFASADGIWQINKDYGIVPLS
jgi:uncharacterized protein (DUF58 family)